MNNEQFEAWQAEKNAEKDLAFDLMQEENQKKQMVIDECVEKLIANGVVFRLVALNELPPTERLAPWVFDSSARLAEKDEKTGEFTEEAVENLRLWSALMNQGTYRSMMAPRYEEEDHDVDEIFMYYCNYINHCLHYAHKYYWGDEDDKGGTD